MYEQGRLIESEDLYRKALEGREKVIGKRHADTIGVNRCRKEAACGDFKRSHRVSGKGLGRYHTRIA